MATFDPDFDHVYGVRSDAEPPFTAGHLIGHYLPTIAIDPAPGGDVTADDVPLTESDWNALRGFTGQWSYSGAVMHPSELWTPAMLAELRELADDGVTVFAVVEVADEDGSLPDGDPIGWAVIYRTIQAGERCPNSPEGHRGIGGFGYCTECGYRP